MAKGHYARFTYQIIDARTNADAVRQVFGDALDMMPVLKAGKYKGQFKATMIKKVCTYGGATPNGEIAKPGDTPQIWVIPRVISPNLGPTLNNDEITMLINHQLHLYSGSLGVFADDGRGTIQKF